ncbi:MAG TPA: hypothetical protein VF173_22805 [Thermoanaerobaculia bacterium]|nr:hypothetical protein [Thermoanaerobaculia bacterium]
MDPTALGDALTATYRGARESRRLRLQALTEMEVTLSHDLGCFRATIPPPA